MCKLHGSGTIGIGLYFATVNTYTYKQLMPERQNTAKQEDTRGLRVAEIGKVESAMWS